MPSLGAVVEPKSITGHIMGHSKEHECSPERRLFRFFFSTVLIEDFAIDPKSRIVDSPLSNEKFPERVLDTPNTKAASLEGVDSVHGDERPADSGHRDQTAIAKAGSGTHATTTPSPRLRATAKDFVYNASRPDVKADMQHGNQNMTALQVIGPRRQPVPIYNRTSLGSPLGKTLTPPTNTRIQEQRIRNNVRFREGFHFSFAWTVDLDFNKHKRDMQNERLQMEIATQTRLAQEQRDRDFYHAIGMSVTVTRVMEQSLGSRDYLTQDLPIVGLNRYGHCLYGSAVLNQKSMWSVGFEHSYRPKVAWPGLQELKYEGPDRISTDRIHRRMLPYPRVCTDDSVEWAQRDFLQAHVFDEVGYPFRHFFDGTDMLRLNSVKRAAEEAFFAAHWIDQVEFTKAVDDDTPDAEGMHALGQSLFDAMDI